MTSFFKAAAVALILSPFAVLASSTSVHAQDFRSPAPAGAKVYFIEPKDGAEVTGPITIKMGLSGMGVAPAGVEKKDTGHHHVLINGAKFDPMAPLPADDTHKHFGGGQTETSITLPAGKHTLQLVLGDHNHIPHNPAIVSETITVTVK